jgi:hypothetical protein
MFVGLAIGRPRLAASPVLPTQAMRSRRMSSASKLPDTPGSRLRRVGPSDLVLRLKPRNRPPMVLWENHQTPRARPGLPSSLLTRLPSCTGSIVHDFVLLVSPLWPAPSPAIHRVPRTEPTCLSISLRPLKAEDLSCPFFICNNTN